MSNFIENIKQKVGIYLYQKKRKVSTDRRFISLGNSNSFLIIFNAENSENYNAVKELKKRISELSAGKVTIVGYNNNGGNTDFISDSSNMFFTRDDFSFFYQPKSEDVKRLLDSSFDTMFMLSAQPVLPIVLLTRYINAAFKVGRNNVCNDLDFMIDMPNETSIKVIGNQIIDNLEMLSGNR